MHHARKGFVRTIFALSLAASTLSVRAGTITGMSVSETSLNQSAIATYTFTFTPATTINSGNWSDGAYFWFDLDNDFVVSGSTLVSISPSIPGMNIVGRNDSIGEMRLWTSDSNAHITGGQTYVVVISDIQNPATPQTPVAHLIKTGDGSDIIDQGTVAAHAIVVASTTPSVTTPIPDLNPLRKSAGITQYIADLNAHFIDGDGDPLSFSAASSDSSIVAVTLSGPANRTLSLEAKKYGNPTITVTATSIDGFIDDDFDVTAIGVLTVNSLSSSSDLAGALTDLTFDLTLAATVSNTGGDGAYLYFDLPTAYGVGGASLTVTSPSVSGTTYRSAGAANIWFFASASTIAAGSYTVTISNVTNPGNAGSFGNVNIDTRNGGGTTYDEGVMALPGISPTNKPTVTVPIPDVTVNAEDGVTVVESDLHNVFADGDGDPLTFTVVPGHDIAIATASIAGAELSVTGVGPGTTTVTVKADDLEDGAVSNSFDVTVIGLLTPADVQPASLLAGATGAVVVTFTPSKTMGVGDQVVVVYPANFTVSAATLGDVSPGGVKMKLYANAANSVLQITGGGLAIGASAAISLRNITNPSTPGATGNYTIRAQDSGDTVFALATVPGDTMVVPDADGDGMDDEWEITYFGSTNAALGAATDDFDSDGSSNRDEFNAGTHPTNSASVFTFVRGNLPQWNTLSWLSVTSRTYAIYESTDLRGAWPPLPLSNGISGDSSGTNTFTFTPPTNSAAYYRIHAFKP